jgi:hypothetical protein
MAEQFGESIANKEGELGRKILWAVVAVIIGLVILRISCPAISSHLPFGPSGRTLLAQGVDAFDLSYDGKQIAILSLGKLRSVQIAGNKSHQIQERGVVRPGYSWAEVQWSETSTKLAIAACYLGSSSLNIVDLSTNSSQIVIHTLSVKSPVWFGGGQNLAWVQTDPTDSTHWSIFELEEGKRPVRISKAPSYMRHIRLTDAIYFSYPLSKVTEPLWRNFTHPGFRAIGVQPPPGNFPIPLRGFRCWDISPDGTQVAYVYGWSIWIADSEGNGPPREVGRYRPLELHLSPDARQLAFVTTSPESSKGRPIGAGMRVTWPPHELHVINKDGSGHRLACTEPQGIKSIKWLNDNEVLYLSGKDLIRRKL